MNGRPSRAAHGNVVVQCVQGGETFGHQGVQVGCGCLHKRIGAHPVNSNHEHPSRRLSPHRKPREQEAGIQQDLTGSHGLKGTNQRALCHHGYNFPHLYLRRASMQNTSAHPAIPRPPKKQFQSPSAKRAHPASQIRQMRTSPLRRQCPHFRCSGPIPGTCPLHKPVPILCLPEQ